MINRLTLTTILFASTIPSIAFAKSVAIAPELKPIEPIWEIPYKFTNKFSIYPKTLAEIEKSKRKEANPKIKEFPKCNLVFNPQTNTQKNNCNITTTRDLL